MWWCQDEICDCHMPKVTRITPNLKAGYPWINREELWVGDFHSQPDFAERDEMDAQFMAAVVMAVAGCWR